MLTITKKTFFIFLAILLVLFLGLNLIDNPIKRVFYTATASLQSKLWQAGQGRANFLAGFFNSQNLIAENERLFKENLLLQGQLVELSELQAENERLRAALTIGSDRAYQVALIKVVAQPLDQQTILGRLAGDGKLTKGMAVITAEKVLVGSVSDVLGDFAQVALICNQEMSLDVEIGQGALGLAQGTGKETLQLKNVAQAAQLVNGAIITTANLSGKFPPGLLVGQLKSFQKNAAEPFQEGEIEPYFSQNQMDNLFVILDWPIDN